MVSRIEKNEFRESYEAIMILLHLRSTLQFNCDESLLASLKKFTCIPAADRAKVASVLIFMKQEKVLSYPILHYLDSPQPHQLKAMQNFQRLFKANMLTHENLEHFYTCYGGVRIMLSAISRLSEKEIIVLSQVLEPIPSLLRIRPFLLYTKIKAYDFLPDFSESEMGDVVKQLAQKTTAGQDNILESKFLIAAWTDSLSRGVGIIPGSTLKRSFLLEAGTFLYSFFNAYPPDKNDYLLYFLNKLLHSAQAFQCAEKGYCDFIDLINAHLIETLSANPNVLQDATEEILCSTRPPEGFAQEKRQEKMLYRHFIKLLGCQHRQEALTYYPSESTDLFPVMEEAAFELTTDSEHPVELKLETKSAASSPPFLVNIVFGAIIQETTLRLNRSAFFHTGYSFEGKCELIQCSKKLMNNPHL